MSDGLDTFTDLGSSVARLLRAQGRPELAAIIDSARFTPAPPNEDWEIDGRRVVAKRVAMSVSPEHFVVLQERDEDLTHVREAVRAVVRSLTTELSELLVLVERAPLEGALSSSYRMPCPPEPSEPNATEVRALSESLAVALGTPELAELFARAELEMASIGESDLPLRRWIVRLPIIDVARLDGDIALRGSLERIVRIAATSARARVAEVEIAPRLP